MQLDVQSEGWVFPGSTAYDDGRGSVTVELLAQYVTALDAVTLQRLEHDLFIYEDLIVKDGVTTLVADTDYIVGPINPEVSAYFAAARAVPIADIQVVTGIYIQDTGHLNNKLTITGKYAGDEMTMRDFNNLPLAGAINSYDYFNEYTKNQVVAFASQIYISEQPGNLGNPPKVDRVVTGAYRTYTNEITDLATTGSNKDVTSSTIGTLNGQDLVQLVSIVNGTAAYRLSNSFIATTTDGVFLVIGRKGSEEDTKIIFRNTADSTDDEIIRIVYSTKTISTDSTGVVLNTNWIDDDTFQTWIYIDTAIIGKTYVFRYSMNSHDTQNIIGATQSWSAPLYVENTTTMFPFVEGTHSADVIDETFSMPDKFIIDMEIDPKFTYDTSIYHRIFEWYIDADQKLILLWNGGGSNHFYIQWHDTGTRADLNTQAFDDGTSLTKINQRLRLTLFFNGVSGDVNGSMLSCIPLESGGMQIDNIFTTAPDIKSSPFPTLSIGNGSGSQQADSAIGYLRTYDWDGVKPTITDSNDVDTYLDGLVPLFETNDEEPRDWWTPWPLNTGIDNTKRPAIDNTIIPKFIGEAHTNLVLDPCDLTTGNWVTTSLLSVDLTDIYIKGNRFTRLSVDGLSNGDSASQIGIAITNGVKSNQSLVIRNENLNESLVYLYDGSITIIHVEINWTTKTLDFTGDNIDYEWIDDITLEMFMISSNATNTNARFYINPTYPATDAGSLLVTACQIVDDTTTMFPFVEGTHAADTIDVEQTMPDIFAVDMIIDPKFAYDVSGHRMILTWFIDSLNVLYVVYNLDGDTFSIWWRNANSTPAKLITSVVFDSTNINQRIRLTVFLNLISGGINDSRLVISQLEQDLITNDTTWNITPYVRTADFFTLSIGNLTGGNQTDSNIEYIRLYKWDGVDVGTITSNEQLEVIMQDMDMIFEAIPDAFVPREITTDTPISSALQQITNDLRTAQGIQDGAILPRHMNNAQEGLPDGLAELSFNSSSTFVFPDWVGYRASDDLIRCVVNWPEIPKQGAGLTITLPSTSIIFHQEGASSAAIATHTISNFETVGKHVHFYINQTGIGVGLVTHVGMNAWISGTGCKLTIT